MEGMHAAPKVVKCAELRGAIGVVTAFKAFLIVGLMCSVCSTIPSFALCVCGVLNSESSMFCWDLFGFGGFDWGYNDQ